MTSALFWAIDRGKEPSNLATVLLCTAHCLVWLPVNRQSLRWVLGRFWARLGPELCSLCSPTGTAEMQGCNTIAPLACVLEGNILRRPLHPSSIRTHSFWRYVRTRTSTTAPHFYTSVYLSNQSPFDRETNHNLRQ
jgi:hypothetical protein